MVTAGRNPTATDESPAHTYFKQITQNLFPPFSADNPHAGLAQPEVRCSVDGKCVLGDRTWPAGSLRELEALL